MNARVAITNVMAMRYTNIVMVVCGKLKKSVVILPMESRCAMMVMDVTGSAVQVIAREQGLTA